jgi:ABC-2 type transport system permease protein
VEVELMQKVLVVAAREFWGKVRTRGFVLSSIFTPVILLVVWATGSLSGPMEVEEAGGDPNGGGVVAEQQEADDELSLIAYVDEANIIQRVPETLPDEMFRAYADEAAAQAALEVGEFEAYFVIEADYRETGNVRRVSDQLPASPPFDTNVLDALLQANLLPEATPQELARVRAPFQSPSLQVTALDGADEDVGDETNGLPMMPFLVTVLVMIPLFTSASYLLASLAQEKSSRVMEILLVSLRPRDLLAGKLLGLGALTMVQYVIWIVLGAGAFFLLGADLSVVTNTINLTVEEVGLVLLYALGGYALYAALMAGLGALSPNLEATRTWVFVITLPMLIPMYTWVMLVNSPHSVLSVALSLFPFSAPIAMLMRLTSTTVPGWQIALSLALVGLTAVGMVWLMSRLFLAQTLLSGESFSPHRFWTVVRGA